MDAISNFTPRAQQVLALGRKEAERLNHSFLGTEHVLLGIMKLGEGTAVKVLTKRGIKLETLRLEVEKQVGTGPDQRMISNIPYTPRVKKVIALAQKEAKQLNHTYVGTEHLLLGLLRGGDGVAAKILRSLNVEIEQTRQDILDELGQNIASENSDDEGPNLDNLTPRAELVLGHASDEAARLNHGFVGTEHLLLGLLRVGRGMAINVLSKVGLGLETARARVGKHLPKEPDQKNIENLPYTPQAKEVFVLGGTSNVAA